MNIAVIPARGGSKRIPRKNIKQFADKPMIAHAISAAKESNLFSNIIVSSDDKEIISIANTWGAETPFVRPQELSDDFTPTVPVIRHAMQECMSLGIAFNKVCCIYPCVPFLQSSDLINSYEILNKEKAGYCFPIAEYPSAIQRSLKMDEKNKLQPFFPEHQLTRTQDLEASYYDAGQFYWGTNEAWLNNDRIHSDGLGYLIPSIRSVDIDTPDDWVRAECLYQLHKNS